MIFFLLKQELETRTSFEELCNRTTHKIVSDAWTGQMPPPTPFYIFLIDVAQLTGLTIMVQKTWKSIYPQKILVFKRLVLILIPCEWA